MRLAEFDDLFATAVRRDDPVGATHARLHLMGPAGLAAQVRDLTARETECCSYFTFTAQPATDGEAVVLDVEVPAAHADVLESLTTRTSAVSAACVAAPSPVLSLWSQWTCARCSPSCTAGVNGARRGC